MDDHDRVYADKLVGPLIWFILSDCPGAAGVGGLGESCSPVLCTKDTTVIQHRLPGLKQGLCITAASLITRTVSFVGSCICCAFAGDNYSSSAIFE